MTNVLLLTATAPPNVELFDYYYDDVPNDTYSAAYNTLFNWTYIASEDTETTNPTVVYVVLGVSGVFVVLIFLMDFTHLV